MQESAFTQCVTCEYWDRHEASDKGRCLGKIPNASLVPMPDAFGQPRLSVITFWPETSEHDGCAEGSPSELLLAASRQGISLLPGDKQ